MGERSLYIREWGEIHQSEKNSVEDFDKIYLNPAAWNFLAKYANSSEKNHRFLKFKNSEILKVQNFVGVIATPDGTQIEILPKINTDKNGVDKSRKTLTKMLKVVNKLTFIETTEADLQLNNQLLEVVISNFLNELGRLIKKGIRFDYSRIKAQEKFLKGQLQLGKQLNEPPHKQHLFHLEYDVFLANRVENRLLHSALLLALKFTKKSQNQRNAKHFLIYFDEVPLAKDYKNEFRQWSKNRDMNYYQAVLPWLKLILNQQSPLALNDNNAGISFLFPMEQLFEQYVAKILAKNLPAGYRLTEQKPQKYLAKKPQTFRLKPDIVISDEQGLPIYILDTKWKLINESQKNQWGNQDGKKGVSQSDVYQIFAYGKKYKVKNVALIYPKWDKFREDFGFELDEDLHLCIRSFALDDDKMDVF
jgi:5-methylcytosine-specific restriction enzyme subunit McrC